MNLPFEPAIYEHKAALIGEAPERVSRSADLIVRAVLEEHRVYGADLITVGIDVYNIEAEALGAELGRVAENACPEVARPLYDLADLPELEPPRIPQAGRFALMLEAGQRVMAAIGDRVRVRVGASGPVSIASRLVGLEPLIMGLAMGDREAVRLLDFTTGIARAWCGALRQAGLAVIVFDSAASPPLFSPPLFAEHVEPRHRSIMRTLAESGQIERPLILGGDTSSIVPSLLRTEATTLIRDFAADARPFAAALTGSGIAVRRNAAPAALMHGEPETLARHYVQDLMLFERPIAGTGILPYDFDPAAWLRFRDRVRDLWEQSPRLPRPVPGN